MRDPRWKQVATYSQQNLAFRNKAEGDNAFERYLIACNSVACYPWKAELI